jgi:hypothetical protein
VYRNAKCEAVAGDHQRMLLDAHGQPSAARASDAIMQQDAVKIHTDHFNMQ